MGFWNVYDKKGEYVGSISDNSCAGGADPVLVFFLELIAVIGIAFLFREELFNLYFKDTLICVPVKESIQNDDLFYVNGLSELFSYWKNGGFVQKVDVVQTILPPVVGFVLLIIHMIKKAIRKELVIDWILSPLVFIANICLNLCTAYLLFSMIGGIFDRAGQSVGTAFICYFCIYWLNTLMLLLVPVCALIGLKVCGIFGIFEGIADMIDGVLTIFLP